MGFFSYSDIVALCFGMSFKLFPDNKTHKVDSNRSTRFQMRKPAIVAKANDYLICGHVSISSLVSKTQIIISHTNSQFAERSFQPWRCLNPAEKTLSNKLQLDMLWAGAET